MTVIHWFRRDLRLSDNTALNAALDSGEQVIPLFIFDPAILSGERFGAPRFAYLLKALESLERSLQASGGRLLIRYGNPSEVLPHVIQETGARALYYNTDYSPYARKRDQQVSQGVPVSVIPYHDALIHAPGEVQKADGGAYTVFAPFRQRWESLPKPEPRSTILRQEQFHTLEGIEAFPVPTLPDFELETSVVIPETGEALGMRRLQEFVGGAIFQYAETRDRLIPNPFTENPPVGASYLSPFLRFGMVSARQADYAAREALREVRDAAERHSVEMWISELAWRDFYTHILYFFPHVYQRSFKPECDQIDFREDAEDFQRWQEGQTGYPLVDAAMRQLKALGWMPNRARMIVASFLTRDLLIYWKHGDVHFMNWLIDGDPAANNAGWQWAAGTGTDPQPLYRIFNPVAQSRKFDPNGDYIRAFVPELRDLPTKYIHTPWETGTPPNGYPLPMVDHTLARERAMQAFSRLKLLSS